MNNAFKQYLKHWMYTFPNPIFTKDSDFETLVKNVDKIHQGFLIVEKEKELLGYPIRHILQLKEMFLQHYKIIKDVSSNRILALLYARSNILYSKELIRYLLTRTY